MMKSYLEVACPTCGAEEGRECQTAGGNRREGPHATRRRHEYGESTGWSHATTRENYGDARLRTCPRCGAKPDRPCQQVNGLPWLKRPHKERRMMSPKPRSPIACWTEEDDAAVMGVVVCDDGSVWCDNGKIDQWTERAPVPGSLRDFQKEAKAKEAEAEG